MKWIPSRRLASCCALLAGGSFFVIAFPRLWLVLAALDLLLLLVAVLDWLLMPSPHLLECQRLAPERMSVLNEQAISLIVRNRSQVRLHVRSIDTAPVSFQTRTEVLAGTVTAQGERTWQYQVMPLTRGLFTWGSIYLRYRSLLGLWEHSREISASTESRVYPNLASLYRHHLLARTNHLDTLGIRRIRLRGGSWEFESLREYVRGDDQRLIDWKASARRRKLIVRNQQAERNQTVILMIDNGRLMNAEEDGIAKLDHAVNTALILAHVALARGDRVGLCTFSHKVHSWLTPRPHLGQMKLITEALYDLRGDYTETDHGRCLRFLSARHRKRALLVVLTDFVDAETASEMIAHVQRATRRHLVLFTALKDRFLTQAAHGRPQTSYEGYRKAAATELLHERREVMERLHQMGAHVLDVEPSELTPPVINRYLEVTFRGLL